MQHKRSEGHDMASLTREQRRERNRAAWARREERMAEQRRETHNRRAKERDERRERNRAAWWQSRLGVLPPGPIADRDGMPHCAATSVKQPERNVWTVKTQTGRNVAIERHYIVELAPDDRVEVDSLQDAATLINHMTEADYHTEEQTGAAFVAGSVYLDYDDCYLRTFTVVRATRKQVTLEMDEVAHNTNQRVSVDPNGYISLYTPPRGPQNRKAHGAYHPRRSWYGGEFLPTQRQSLPRPESSRLPRP